MGDLDNALKKLTGMESAIERALREDVAPVVRDAIVASARENVYDAYTPRFLSRRNGNGGILDPGEIDVDVVGLTLTARDAPDWQHLWGGPYPNVPLAEAIADGNPRFHMQNAGPRPFHEKAKERLLAEGDMEAALRRGLERQGFDTSGVVFKFT